MATAERLIGAAIVGAVDGAVEGYWQKTPEVHDKFPFIEIHPSLPPVDDLLMAVLPAVIYGAGVYAENETVKNLGEGGLAYAIAMLLHHTLIRNI